MDDNQYNEAGNGEEEEIEEVIADAEGDEEEYEEVNQEDGDVGEEDGELPSDEELVDDDLEAEGDTDMQVYKAAYSGATRNFTVPYMTKYEIARVIGLRYDMLCKGAPPTVSATEFPGGVYPKNAEEIAKMELRKNRSPFMIKRPLPGGLYVTIPVSDLIIPGHVLN